MTNVNDFSKDFRKEDQQEIWDFVVRRLISGEPLEIRKRKSVNISLEGTEEEVLRRMSTALGFPIELLKKNGALENLRAFKESSNHVDRIILPFRAYLQQQKNVQKSKFDELRDLGCFLIALNEGYEIDVPTENYNYPDFIIKKDLYQIGVEHTRLIQRPVKEDIQYIRVLLKSTTKMLLDKNSKLTGIVNVVFDYNASVIGDRTLSSSKFKKVETEQIARQLADYIRSYLNNESVDSPSFIKQASYQPTSTPIHLDLVEEYLGRNFYNDVLTTTLEPKELKHFKYSAVKDFHELWLLVIVQSTTGASSFVLDSAAIENRPDSKFDKVFLFDTVSNEIRRLK